MTRKTNTLEAWAEKETGSELYGMHTRANPPAGWYWRDTPGHGYLHPTEEANRRVPNALRESNYEEDIDYNIPILFNAHLFTREAVEYAQEQIKNYYYKDYERIFKVTLKKGESSTKDREHFTILENEGNYLVRCAMGDWAFDVPKGKVYVEAVKIKKGLFYNEIQKGEIESFLIEPDVYRGRDGEVLKTEWLTPYKRDESFYTWENYGKPRFK
jgi:hypothetical protein